MSIRYANIEIDTIQLGTVASWCNTIQLGTVTAQGEAPQLSAELTSAPEYSKDGKP